MKHQQLQTTEAISKRMAHVHLKRGPAETKLAKALWHSGVRYRLNFKSLPGSPDIAITKYKIAVFVDGEFWHGKDWEQRKIRLRNNKEYWIEKIEENIARDRRNDALLDRMGWYVLHFWSGDVKKRIDYCLSVVLDSIRLLS